MEMTKKAKKVEQYELEDGFFCDIIYDKNSFEAWLWHKGCGVKEFIVGLDRKMNDEPKEEFVETVMTIWTGAAYEYIKNNNRKWYLNIEWLKREEYEG